MKAKWVRVAVILVLLAAIAVAVNFRDQFDAAAVEHWIQNAGVLAPLVFMLVYALGAVLFLPGTVLTLAGGALFGPVLGTFYNLTGATIGAALAFLVSRYVASDWVADKTGGRLKQLINGVEAEGWRFVAFVRLVPLFPFNLLNYALGLTRIRFSHYVLATYICMLPAAFAYTYLGYAGREAVGGGEGLIQKALLALTLLAVVAFLPRLIGHFRKRPSLTVPQLKQRLDQGEDILVLDVRTAADFVGEQGHIVGATNLPLEELLQRCDEISDYQEKPVVTVCRTDRRSDKAARLLAQRGFADVHVVTNGMTGWNENGYPLAKI
ncbi:MAG: sulfurtransferase [Gammaproteobacteria bacterium]|nr:sulfurtransferase [Gammaproteobacteria bacterium]